MPTSLYIQLDFFHAGAWQAAGDAFHAESYAHDRDYSYLVLQPFLIANSAKAASPAISEYLSGWTGATLAQPGRVVPLDETLINTLNMEGTFTATPVPFPPGTSLSLKLGVTSVPAIADLAIARTLEGAGINPTAAFVLDTGSWPEFAARNYLNIPILVWGQFTPSQRSQILDWVYGLMIALRRKSDAGTLSDKEAPVWNNFFKDVSPADGSKEAWQPLLEAGTPPLGMNVLTYLYDPSHTAPGEKNLNPPQYMHTPDSIRQFKAAAFPVAPPATYHSLLWSTFADLVAKGGDERAVTGALGRYYGFGERLRWPKAAAGQEGEYFKHFMVVQPTDENAADPWFVTNAHSLAGQVFRVGPIADSVQVTGVNVTEFNIQGNSIIAGGAANPYQTHFLEMLTEARALRASGQMFSCTLDRDQTNPVGRVIFTPRNAYAQDSALQTDEALGAGLLLQVPGSLLDALDPRARVEFPADSTTTTDSISRRYPQRKLIRKEELANDFSSVEWNKVTFLLEAKMDLVELSLATGLVPSPGRLYELRLSGEWHGDDLPFVARALGSVNGDSTASVWVQQALPNGAKTIKRFSLKGTVLESRVDGGTPLLIVNDKDGILAGLLPPLNAPPKPSASPVPAVPQKFYSVDFACAASTYWTAGNRSFNSLFYGGNKAQDIPALVLASHFQHQVSLCADRLLERFP